MSHYSEIAFTPEVRAAQEEHGFAAMGAKMLASPADDVALTERERTFIGERDSFYIASVGSTGWPYVQHRGGPRGFLQVIDPSTLAFADFRGNRQYITTGNITSDDRVSLFLMDYAHRRRLKLYGRARVARVADESALAARLTNGERGSEVDRVVVFLVEAFDWNCPKYITPRFTVAELGRQLSELRAEIESLRAEKARLVASSSTG